VFFVGTSTLKQKTAVLSLVCYWCMSWTRNRRENRRDFKVITSKHQADEQKYVTRRDTLFVIFI